MFQFYRISPLVRRFPQIAFPLSQQFQRCPCRDSKISENRGGFEQECLLNCIAKINLRRDNFLTEKVPYCRLQKSRFSEKINFSLLSRSLDLIRKAHVTPLLSITSASSVSEPTTRSGFTASPGSRVAPNSPLGLGLFTHADFNPNCFAGA